MGSEKIAIIGSYGSGKTVLLTVLTHLYQKQSPEGYQILPNNLEAITFCQKNWKALQEGQWPPPTCPQENPPIYSWKLRFGTKEKDIITSDIAGEAWRSFIENNISGLPATNSEMSLRARLEAIPKSFSQNKSINNHLLTIETLLKNASRIYFVLDLSQIVDKEIGYEKAEILPCCLQRYMETIHKTKVPIILVLSKIDKYKYLFETTHDWRVILENYIPYLPQHVNIIPIAAVAKTKTKNGVQIPAPDFPSEGIDKLYESFWDTKINSKAIPQWVVLMTHALVKHSIRFFLGG